MIKVDQIERIRKLVLVQGVSERQAAKQVGVSRHAVRIALEGGSPRKYQLARPKPRPIMGRVEKLIDEMLRSDEGKPPKQRHTARRIWLRLRDEYGFQGSEPSVRRIVAALRQKPPEVFIPLAHEPGEEAQVDFGEAEVIIAGVRQTVQLFCMKLCYSRLPFVIAFPHQRQEAFFEGHRQGFEFFGGVPRRLTYDNLKVAVRRILEGHDREEQIAFKSLRAHYLFESHFCTPERGNEKGQVENLVGYVRRNALVPIPEVRSLAELNALLRKWCLQETDRTVAGTNGTIGEHWEAERSVLLPLPVRPFDCARVVFAKVNRYAQVTYDTVVYSVPWQYGYRSVTLKAYVDRVEIWIEQQRIAQHERSYQRNGSVLALGHYLEVFLRKPGTLRYSIPYKQALLPQAFDRLHNCFKWAYPRSGDKEFVHVLMLLQEYALEDVEWAATEALQRGSYSADAVRTLLLLRGPDAQTPQALDPEQHRNLPTVDIPPARIDHFNRLLPKGGVVH